MSVKRYQMQESYFGPFVTYRDYLKLDNDYAALEARHNALLEAVAWERKAADAYNDACVLIGYGQLAWATENLKKARAEVDRLLGEE